MTDPVRAQELMKRVRLGHDLTEEEAKFLIEHLSIVLGPAIDAFQDAVSTINHTMMTVLGAMTIFNQVTDKE